MRNTRIVALQATLLFVLLLLSSGDSHAQSGRSWMKGMIFADSGVEGLPGALVELTGEVDNERLRNVHLTARTDERGWYSMEQIPYGGYTFRVSADGYVTYEIPLYIGSDMLTQIHANLKKKE